MKEGKHLKKALLKCATGLSTSEVVEEFAMEDGEMKLVKKKVTTRDIPPDIKAVKLLLDETPEPTDEELEAEKQRLVRLLNNK